MTFDANLPIAAETCEDLIAIDGVLLAVATQYERQSHVVELRFFGGLSVEETADSPPEMCPPAEFGVGKRHAECPHEV